MYPETEKQLDEETSKQLPVDPVIEARPEETYTEPEVPEVPQTDSAEAQSAVSSAPASSEPPKNPQQGKTLAIVGLVLAVLPLQLFGLIVSIIAKVRAQSGTPANTLAIIGIILNIMFGLVTTGVLVALVLTAQAGILERIEQQKETANMKTRQQYSPSDEQRSNAAKSALAGIHATVIANAYSALEGKYPTTVAQLQSVTPLEIISLEPLENKPKNPSIVEYAVCDSGAAYRVGIWDYETNEVSYLLYPEEYAPQTEPDCGVVAQIYNKERAEEESEPLLRMER